MTQGCQVDFYVLNSPELSAQSLACRLAMMAWEQGHRIAVLTPSPAAASSLDQAMWDYPAGRFLPHGIGAAGSGAPVRIDCQEQDIDSDRDVVINLSDEPLADPARFARLLEIVPGDAEHRSASRRKFSRYREQGLAPAHHKIGRT
jgi:DNA polymerase-3 subunit chi